MSSPASASAEMFGIKKIEPPTKESIVNPFPASKAAKYSSIPTCWISLVPSELSDPIVNQLSNSSSGKKGINAGLIPVPNGDPTADW